MRVQIISRSTTVAVLAFFSAILALLAAIPSTAHSHRPPTEHERNEIKKALYSLYGEPAEGNYSVTRIRVSTASKKWSITRIKFGKPSDGVEFNLWRYRKGKWKSITGGSGFDWPKSTPEAVKQDLSKVCEMACPIGD